MDILKSQVSFVLEGYNVTVFAYGQTGTGKTYSMIGTEDTEVTRTRRKRSMSPCRSLSTFKIATKGLLLLAMDDIFALSYTSERLYTLTCSYLEIYNENINDLLAADSGENLTISEDPTKGFYVKGLCERNVRSSEDILEILSTGENKRKYGSTDLNKHSSRSHTIFTVNITWIRADCTYLEGMFNFVDLAGSERIISNQKKPSNTEGLNECKHINTSLFYLCQVIYKLSEKQSNQATHVPYRNSNLTKILRNSIGGNSFTSILCTASPCISSYEMTQSTIHLASLARTITNKAVVNTRYANTLELMKIYQNDIQTLTFKIQRQRFESKTIIEKIKSPEKKIKKRNMVVGFCRNCRSDNKYLGWIKGVGDVEARSDREQKCQRCEANRKETEELNAKIAELESRVEPLQMQIQILLKMVDENQNTIENKNKIIEKKDKDFFQILDYIKGLKKKIEILEGRALGNMSEDEILRLEKFYFKLIDEAKESRLCRNYNSTMVSEKSQKINKKYLLWPYISGTYPSTPTYLASYNKENIEPPHNFDSEESSLRKSPNKQRILRGIENLKL